MAGFEALWNSLAAVVEQDLAQRFPGERGTLPMVDASNFERVMAETVQQLRRARVRLLKANRKVVEAAVIYAISEGRLVSAARVAHRIRDVPPPSRSTDECAVALEYWWIALSRHLEAFNALWTAAESLAVSVAGFSAARADVRDWVKERQADIARQRNSIAHANPVWVRAIDEDGLWEPMFMLGLGDVGTLENMLKEHEESDRTRFDFREDILRKVTALTLANADAMCSKLGKFIDDGTDPGPIDGV